MNTDQLRELLTLVDEIPKLTKKFGKDGEYITAFFEDAKDAINVASTDEEKVALFNSLTLVVLKGIQGTKGFKLFNLFNFDPLKDMRLKCDDVARLLDFKRYKALRKL